MIIHESEAVVNEWVSEINSLISLNVSLKNYEIFSKIFYRLYSINFYQGGSSSNQLISPCNIDDSDNVKSRNFSKKGELFL